MDDIMNKQKLDYSTPSLKDLSNKS